MKLLVAQYRSSSPEQQLQQNQGCVSAIFAQVMVTCLDENSRILSCSCMQTRKPTQITSRLILIQSQTSNMHLEHKIEPKHTRYFKKRENSSFPYLDRY